MNPTPYFALLVLAMHCPMTWAVEFVVSGKVVETGGSNGDKPVTGATVVLFDDKNSPISTTLTNTSGNFYFRFPSVPSFSGKEYARISKPGYSRNPTTLAVTLKRSEGLMLAFQGEVPLTDEEAIRSNSTYRNQVGINAKVASDTGQKEKANAIYASIAGLPDAEKKLVFGNVLTHSESAYSELLKVDEELMKAREFENSIKRNLSPSLGVLRFDSSGSIRLTGTVKSQQDMDNILKQAGDKGFGGGKIVNEMRIQGIP